MMCQTVEKLFEQKLLNMPKEVGSALPYGVWISRKSLPLYIDVKPGSC